MKIESRDDANIVIPGGAADRHNDNDDARR